MVVLFSKKQLTDSKKEPSKKDTFIQHTLPKCGKCGGDKNEHSLHGTRIWCCPKCGW